MRKLIPIASCLLLFSGCVGTESVYDQSEDAVRTKGSAPASLRHESLYSVLWTQTSVEFGAVTEGAYALAALRLDEALADPLWTASLEQLAAGSYAELPPAVVLDVDETVLDNAAYQARLIEDDESFASSSWNAWVAEEKARPIQGALQFTRYAASKGVKVIYLTNRVHDVEQATRNNLAALGFPLDPSDDTILTKAERREWASSDKTSRRTFVADQYRILLLIGDNFGDFSEAASGPPEERALDATEYQSFWGRKWIALPNPMYGSWDSALYESQSGDTQTEMLLQKRSHLKTDR